MIVDSLKKEYSILQSGVKPVDAGGPGHEGVDASIRRAAGHHPAHRKYLNIVRGIFGKGAVGILPINSAGLIADVHPAYESYDLP